MSAAAPRAPPLPDAAALRLRLLGPFAAWDADGHALDVPFRKTRAVLALLGLAAPRPVPRDRLIALLWSRRDREQGLGSLRQCVHQLNTLLKDSGLLRIDRHYVALQERGLALDLHAFDSATPSDPALLDMLRRPLLEDLVGLDPAFDRWLAEERGRLLERGMTLAEASLDIAATPEARATAASRLLALAPVHEGAWRALMQVEAATGGNWEAVYERCRAALASAGVATPSEETEALRGELAPVAGGEAPARLRLGVLPLSPSPGAVQGVHQALASEITAALARFPWLGPVAVGIGEPEDRSAGVEGTERLDFLLDGTLQQSGARVRVTMRLIDARPPNVGEVVWGQRFDGTADDLLSLQDAIVAATAAQVEPALLLREGRRATARPASHASAEELLLRAIPALYRMEESGFRAAGRFLEEAVRRAPDFAAAYAWLAYWHIFLVGQGWTGDPHAVMTRGGELAERAVALDPRDARALTTLGHVRAFLDRRTDEAIALHQRALEANPNLPLAWAFAGLALAYAGRHDEAIHHIEQAMKLSPVDPHAALFDMALALPLTMRGDFARAANVGRRAIAVDPSLSSSWKGYLTALGHLGDADMATARDRLLKLEPGFSVQAALARSPLQREEDRALYADGLRRAGLPEQA